MGESQIFEHLLDVAKESKDPEGVVAACLVRNGEVLIARPSSDDSQYHAEYLVIKELEEKGLQIEDGDILYTTLEPCSDLPGINDGRDCTTCILDAGVKHVVYAAKDPEYSTKAADRLKEAQISYRQVDDEEIVKLSANLYNSTITKKLSDMKLPRQDKL